MEIERDLGVRVNSCLNWSFHVGQQVTSANRMLGFVRRSTIELRDLRVRRTVYLTIVRPQLGYATQVWCPQSIGLIRRVERVQRRVTKHILCLPFQADIPYEERLKSSKLLPISYWHEFLDLILFYKIIKNMVYVDPDCRPTPYYPARSTRSSFDPNILASDPRDAGQSHIKHHIFQERVGLEHTSQ